MLGHSSDDVCVCVCVCAQASNSGFYPEAQELASLCPFFFFPTSAKQKNVGEKGKKENNFGCFNCTELINIIGVPYTAPYKYIYIYYANILECMCKSQTTILIVDPYVHS